MMAKDSYRKAIIGNAVSLALLASQASLAQEQTAREAEAIEEIVVTGSQIRGARTTGALPVTVVGRDQIQDMGGVSGEDLYRALPQGGDVSFNTQTLSGGSQGAARGDVSSINLRSIGPGYTLVLLNGRRMVPHPTSQGQQEFSYNANTIPIFALERLEILRDGAAALYGADAVAGVVNNVFRSNYDGFRVEAQYGAAEGTNLDQLQLNALWGTSVFGGRGNITSFLGYGSDSKLYARDQEYTASNDIRPLLAGTSFENNPAFNRTTPGSAWGGFQVIGGPGAITSDGTPVTNDAGQFHIQPATNPGCLYPLNGICIDDGNVTGPEDANLRFDPARGTENLTVTPSIDRLNFFSSLNYDLSEDIEFFGELGYYTAKSQSVSLPVGPLGNTPVTVPASNYYNPFGPVGSPNRLPGLNIPDEGLPMRILSYLAVDAGARVVDVRTNQGRVLGGLRGEKFGWDWESAALYSWAKANDVSGGIQTSLWQAAMARSTPDAYNPFNGGDIANPSLDDTTPSQDLTSYVINVTRTGRATLALWDFKLSKGDLFTLPAGGLGVATGVEVRRETTEDDRERTGDFSTPFIDLVTGVAFDSDTLGASAAFDIKGDRTVYSVYAELAIPIVSPEMNIPLIHAMDLQVAGRFEDYSDIGNIAKPKFAGSWDIVEGVRLRGSWQEGFKAPTLEQLAPVIRPTQQARLDDVLCEADLRAGRISSWGECNRRPPVQRLTGGNENLRPEESESYSYGLVLQATFLPIGFGDLTLTADYWQIEQENRVSFLSAENALTLDYLMRVQGSFNADVQRAEPTAADIEFVAGTGLAPIGEVLAVVTNYENLDVRTIKGYDLGLNYALADTAVGDFSVNLNVSRTLDHFQSPSPIQQQLLDAQAAGTINEGAAIGGAADLLQDSGNPKWKWFANSSWNKDNWGAGVTAQFTDKVYQFNVRDPDNEPWEVESQLSVSLYGEYRFTQGIAENTAVRVGVRNLTDEAPPLASFGYLGQLYQPYARQWYARINKSFE